MNVGDARALFILAPFIVNRSGVALLPLTPGGSKFTAAIKIATRNVLLGEGDLPLDLLLDVLPDDDCDSEFFLTAKGLGILADVFKDEPRVRWLARLADAEAKVCSAIVVSNITDDPKYAIEAMDRLAEVVNGADPAHVSVD